MAIAGIVAEYNPFHTGHQHQIAETRAQLGQDTPIVVAMSGNWVQQASCAIFDKWTRAELAILGGADLILELPTPYATASAEGFCRGAVDILAATGLVTHLSFGSEGGQIASLQKIADCIDSPEFREGLKVYLSEGLSFPAARQKAMQDMLGEAASLLASPNNTLGIEYLRSITGGNYNIEPITVLRRGGGHNSIPEENSGAKPEFTSATDLRQRLIQENNWDYVSDYLPQGGLEFLKSQGKVAKLELVERGILAKIRQMSALDWALLPDSGEEEGLPQRLVNAAKTAKSCEEFYELAKTKRYTHARLRRLTLWAFLGIDQNSRPERPPYLRVLAFNERGRGLLKQMKETATVPILNKTAQWENLDPIGRALFQLESRCSDLYTLCLEEIGPVGLEFTKSAVYIK